MLKSSNKCRYYSALIVAFNDTFIKLGLCSSVDHFADVSLDKYFITDLKNMKNVVCGLFKNSYCNNVLLL